MISKRIWVNLAAFVLLFLVLASWAVRNVVKIDRLERPYEIEAHFDSSPGLRPNVEATYLGVHVGTISSVELDQGADRSDGSVRVVLKIDRGVDLPTGLSAAVRRKSAVGEPYVALVPPEPGTGELIDPSEGASIPLERTTTPLAYGELFASVDELVSKLPPEDLDTVLHEMRIALEDRGPELRRIIASADDITTTLAERSETLDALASELTVLTGVLADHREQLGSSFDDLAALTSTLAQRRGDIATLLAEAPTFGERVDELLTGSYSDLTCSFEDVGSFFGTLDTPQNLAALVRLLGVAGEARDSLDSALVVTGEDGADGPYLGGSFGIVTDDPPPSYDPPRTLPPAKPIVGCAAPGAPSVPDAGDGTTADVLDRAGVPRGPLLVPDRELPAAPDVPTSSDRDAGSQAFPLATLIAVIGLGLGLLLVAGVRPWRWLPVGDREESSDDG